MHNIKKTEEISKNLYIPLLDDFSNMRGSSGNIYEVVGHITWWISRWLWQKNWRRGTGGLGGCFLSFAQLAPWLIKWRNKCPFAFEENSSSPRGGKAQIFFCFVVVLKISKGSYLRKQKGIMHLPLVTFDSRAQSNSYKPDILPELNAQSAVVV